MSLADSSSPLSFHPGMRLGQLPSTRNGADNSKFRGKSTTLHGVVLPPAQWTSGYVAPRTNGMPLKANEESLDCGSDYTVDTASSPEFQIGLQTSSDDPSRTVENVDANMSGHNVQELAHTNGHLPVNNVPLPESHHQSSLQEVVNGSQSRDPHTSNLNDTSLPTAALEVS